MKTDWKKANPDKVKALGAAWYQSNRDKKAICTIAWQKANPEKKKISYAKWQRSNHDKVNAIRAKRRAAKFRATPIWLTEQHFKEIEGFYTLAKELQWLAEEPLEVDHIVPLQGENVSGLHVPWNLQILPKSLNAKKSNRLITDESYRYESTKQRRGECRDIS
jgi:5-methylcytosine-specific restriction endonuclease McrA